MRIPEELRRLYRDGRLVPFVGAGVSKSVAWNEGDISRSGVLWREMVDQAARLLGFEDPSLLRVRGSDLQILEYFQLKKESLAELSLWLHDRMKPSDEALKASAIHTELARLDKCPVVYTTNYDNFIERAFRLHGRDCTVVALESHMGVARSNGAACEVVKFHGDFNYPERMVVTESHYQERLAFETPMDLRFRADMLGRAVLFLGYSFGDQNVAYLFHLVNRSLQRLPSSPSGRRAYIVVSSPSDFEYSLFRARNIEVIATGDQSVSDDVAELLRELQN
jgi:hypothetical protein